MEGEDNMIEKIIGLLLTTNTTVKEMEEIKDYLEQLEDDANKLSYLEAYGVDNWSGYDEAMSEFYKNEER